VVISYFLLRQVGSFVQVSQVVSYKFIIIFNQKCQCKLNAKYELVVND